MLCSVLYLLLGKCNSVRLARVVLGGSALGTSAAALRSQKTVAGLLFTSYDGRLDNFW
jgi:hypothetical protein